MRLITKRHQHLTNQSTRYRTIHQVCRCWLPFRYFVLQLFDVSICPSRNTCPRASKRYDLHRRCLAVSLIKKYHRRKGMIRSMIVILPVASVRSVEERRPIRDCDVEEGQTVLPNRWAASRYPPFTGEYVWTYNQDKMVDICRPSASSFPENPDGQQGHPSGASHRQMRKVWCSKSEANLVDPLSLPSPFSLFLCLRSSSLINGTYRDLRSKVRFARTSIQI